MYDDKAKARTMKYMKSKRDKLYLNFPLGYKERFKAYAESKGMSLTALIIKLIEDELKDKKLLVTIEDNLVQGGMGQYIASQANNTVPVLHLGFDTCFVPHGKQEELFRINALDSKSVCERILTFYKGMTD